MNRNQRREQRKQDLAAKKNAAGEETFVITKRKIKEMAKAEAEAMGAIIAKDVTNKTLAVAILTLFEDHVFEDQELQDFVWNFNKRWHMLMDGEMSYQKTLEWCAEKQIFFVDPAKQPEAEEDLSTKE